MAIHRPPLYAFECPLPPVLRTYTRGDDPLTPASGASFRVPSLPGVKSSQELLAVGHRSTGVQRAGQTSGIAISRRSALRLLRALIQLCRAGVA